MSTYCVQALLWSLIDVISKQIIFFHEISLKRILREISESIQSKNFQCSLWQPIYKVRIFKVRNLNLFITGVFLLALVKVEQRSLDSVLSVLIIENLCR